MMAERETLTEGGSQRTRDVVDLAQNLSQSHVPDPDLDPDPELGQKTADVVGLAQNHSRNHGPDPYPGREERTAHDRNNHLPPPETR